MGAQEHLSREKMTAALLGQPQAGCYSEPAAPAWEHCLPHSFLLPALDTSSPGHQQPWDVAHSSSHPCLSAPTCAQLPNAEILAWNTSLPDYSGL